MLPPSPEIGTIRCTIDEVERVVLLKVTALIALDDCIGEARTGMMTIPSDRDSDFSSEMEILARPSRTFEHGQAEPMVRN